MKLKNTTQLGTDEIVKLAALVKKNGSAHTARQFGASRPAIERAAQGKKIRAETARLLTDQLT